MFQLDASLYVSLQQQQRQQQQLCGGDDGSTRRAHALVFDEPVDVMLRAVLARRHLEHVGRAQQRLLRVAVRHHLSQAHSQPHVNIIITTICHKHTT